MPSGSASVFFVAPGQPYEAIVLDLMLPSMDGFTILKQLRSQGKDTHILILSAKDQLEDRLRGLNLGADDYLVKPFEFEELCARLRALMRRCYQAKAWDLTPDNFRTGLR